MMSKVSNESFVALQKRERLLMYQVEAMTLAELQRAPMLSANAKTGVSLDFPVGHTCRPTKLCASICYAKRVGAPALWTPSLLKRLRTLRYINLARPEDVVDRIVKEHDKLKKKHNRIRLDYLRVNGTGDLFPKLIPVLNLLLQRRPTLLLWVVTRQFGLAAELRPSPNLYLQLSLDSTTTPALRARALALKEVHPRVYFSFLRKDAKEDTLNAAIIFNQKAHSRSGHTRDDLPVEPRRACPADAGRLELGNIRGFGGTACGSCRRCFSPGVLKEVA